MTASVTRRDGNGKPVQVTAQVFRPTKFTGSEVTKKCIGSRGGRLSTTAASAEDSQTRTEINVENEINECAGSRTKINKKPKKLHKYKTELASSRYAHDKLNSELLAVQNLLKQEQNKSTNLAKRLGEMEVSLKSQRPQPSNIMKGKRRCETALENYKAELAYTRDAHDRLERQLIVAQHSLQQGLDEKADVAENLRKFKTLLKSERAQKKEIEESKTRCEALLEEHISRRLLGVGINIQGEHQTLPEIEASIRQTLTITVGEWVEQGSQGLFIFSKGYKWFIPELLAHLFTLCKELVDGFRQQYVDMFLGKVEGAMEGNMDPDSAHFMRNHLQRHHLTLFPAMGITHEKRCRLVTTHLGGIITDFVDGGACCHDRANEALITSGLEDTTSKYLRILVSCAVQCPAVSFSNDIYRMRPFDKRLDFEPIDGDGDVTRGGQFMTIFPAIIANQEESLVNKSFILGPQKQAFDSVHT